MNDNFAERIADGEEARRVLDRWVGPALDAIRADYMEKLAEIASRPLNADNRAGMEKLALAVKVTDAVRAQLKAVVADGDIAREGHKRAENIMKLPAEQRRWAVM